MFEENRHWLNSLDFAVMIKLLNRDRGNYYDFETLLSEISGIKTLESDEWVFVTLKTKALSSLDHLHAQELIEGFSLTRMPPNRHRKYSKKMIFVGHLYKKDKAIIDSFIGISNDIGIAEVVE